MQCSGVLALEHGGNITNKLTHVRAVVVGHAGRVVDGNGCALDLVGRWRPQLERLVVIVAGRSSHDPQRAVAKERALTQTKTEGENRNANEPGRFVRKGSRAISRELSYSTRHDNVATSVLDPSASAKDHCTSSPTCRAMPSNLRCTSW